MNKNKANNMSRRQFSKRALITIASAAIIPVVATSTVAEEIKKTDKPLNIGIVGSGYIGGSVGVLWAKAGHNVFFSSRHPEKLGGLLKQAGPSAKAGLPKEAAAFGDIIFMAVPYHAMPQVGKDLGALIQGKVMIDCGNPYPSRDGDMAVESLKKGTGVASAEFFPGVRLVRAYNSISYQSIMTQAHRDGELMAIPVAADDDSAWNVASKLIKESGFDPVLVGPLSRAREFDNRSALYGKKGTAQELREAFGL
ncbi:MAG: putative dinucleotide-binding enzyme [Oceanicoccus sp.]|jgi:predicted dinucleotide-binding enzyme